MRKKSLWVILIVVVCSALAAQLLGSMELASFVSGFAASSGFAGRCRVPVNPKDTCVLAVIQLPVSIVFAFVVDSTVFGAYWALGTATHLVGRHLLVRFVPV